MNKRRTKLWKQLIAVMLAVALTATSLELTAFAAPADETVTEETVTEDVAEDVAEEEEILAEDTDDSFLDHLADALGIGENDEASVENAEETVEEVPEERSGLEVDEIPVEEVQTDEVLDQDEVPEALILSEVEEEREEDSKTFLLNNGDFLVAQYGTPIHYETEDGTWEEIDNSVAQEDAGTEEEGYGTSEKAGRQARIKFSKKLKEGKTVSIKNTDFPISWGFSGAEKNTVEIQEDAEDGTEQEVAIVAEDSGETEKEKAKKKNDRFLKFDDSSEILRYPDIYENVDVTYQVKTSGIKENLILKQAGTKNTFEIVYDIGKLEAVQVDAQTINLMNGEETIYQIQAPYMRDEAGNYSEEVAIEITELKNKKMTVTMEASEEWLSSEERVYPVILDPVVFTKTAKSAIDTTFVASGTASTNYSGKLELLVGKESSTYKNCRTLVKFTLPELNPGDMVVDADLNLYLYAMDFYASTTPDLQVNAHLLTGSWSLSSVTWNNQPDYDTTILDYNYLERDEEGFQPFDITEAVKSWYEGTADNYGILLKSYNESGTYAETGVKAYFWPERYNEIDDAYPVIQIEYRNNKGLEEYWSYTTLSAGTAGTAYINDYTGNLVFVHEDAVTTGNLLPVTLQHVYNGYTMGTHAAASYPRAGRGWKLSVQQTVKTSDNYGLTGDSLEYYPYAYEDGDGTVHFFYKKTEDGTTRYLDEDGLGLELKISGTTKTITDKEDNVMTFGPKGHLNSIKDASGNEIKISYDSDTYDKPQIKKVTDGAGHVLSFAEHSTETHSVKTVTDPAGRKTSFSFTAYNDAGNASLTTITYPDGTTSTYTYDSNGALKTAVSADGSGLKFYYTSKAKGYRICKVEELAADGTVGQTITFDRSKYNTTVLQSNGSDDVFDTDDDLLTTYQFDNWGRTMATNTRTSSGAYYGGEVAVYTSGTVNSSGSNIKQLNKVSNSAYASRNITNLLKNHSAEKSGSWGKGYWKSSVTYSGEMTEEQSLFGSRAFKLTGTDMPSDGAAVYYQDVDSSYALAGSTYTFSSYIRTSGVVRDTENTADAAYGACLALRFTLSDGSTRDLFSEYRKGTNTTAINKGWVRVSLTYQVPQDATAVRVYLMLRNATGTAYFDGIQLEKSAGMNPYNMLENASFDRLTDGVPDSWNIVSDNSGDGYSTSYYFNGGGSMKLIGNASESKYVYQQVPVSGVENDIYVVSGWARAEAVPDQGDEERPFDIYAMIYYSNGDSVLKSKKAEFNRDVAGWQRVSMAFNLTNGVSGDNLTPTKISIGIRYSKQENIAYFDNIQLLKDVSSSYTYDSEGNIITARESGEQSQAMSYDDASNLTSLTDAENNLYEYEYNDAHQVTEAKSPIGQKVLFSYNSKGVVTSTNISSSGETLQIKYGRANTPETDGIAAGAYPLKEGDPHGYVTAYDHNVQKGTLNSVTTPDGTVTSYTYDGDNDALQKVTSGDAEVTYTYDSSGTKLTEIGHNGYAYQFAYDKYGNVTETTAADRTLVINEYAANNGKLSKVTYGNEDTIEYTYNTAGEVSSVKENGVKTASWKYDSSGLLLEENALEAEQKTVYEYDITGRVSRTLTNDAAVTDTNVDARLYETRYAYDKLNQVGKELVIAGGRSQTAGYTYNENQQPLTLTTSSGASKTYTYDSLGRLKGKSTSTTTAVAQDYLYYTSKRNSSITEDEDKIYRTVQVAKELMGDLGYYYTYDNMGNIVTVRSGTRVEGTTSISLDRTDASYSYDSQGQLIRENNAVSGETVVYGYDNGGNLLSRTIYAYTTAEDLSSLTPSDIITYTYDSSWKDLLLSYDGEDITYDEMGNPLAYRGADLDWQGRTLKSFTKDGTTISYTYGTDGIRTKKTVGSEVHEYYYSSGQLAYEKRGTKEFYYIYDFEGNLSRINYYDGNGNQAYYYPVTNIRGDVQAIYDAAGELAAEYTYDAWGNTLEIRDGDGNAITDQDNIGQLNRIRYRGYYYDAETGFYYVSSRYYDPEVGRFISADTTEVLEVQSDLYDKNLYAYCDNNPIVRKDSTGAVWETVFDVVSLGFSIAEVAANPYDVGAWAGLVGDTIDLVPFVTGVGETVKGLRFIDKAGNTLEIAKATDFTNDAKKTIKSLKRSNGFTKSTASAGRKIHQGYKYGKGFNSRYKEYRKVKGIRPDYYNGKTIFELKPYNTKSAKAGIKQLRKYNTLLGGGRIMRLEFY